MPHPPKQSFNPFVHGLRGLAALLVFLFHVYDMSRLQGLVPEDLYFPLKAAIDSLASGVDLFFMISGYLITASLIRHANVRVFLLDRAIRVYPVFLFLHVSLFVLCPIAGYKWMAGISFWSWLLNFFSNLFFLPGIFNLPLLQLNAWSLSYEFAFYLVSAAIYFAFTQQSWKKLWLLPVMVGLAFVAFYPRAIFFAVGAAVYGCTNGGLSGHPLLKRNWGHLCVLPLFAIAGVAYALGEQKLYWLAAPFGFFIFLHVVRGARPFATLLSHRTIQFLGTISYSFYLWHPVVTYPLKILTAKILVGRMGMDATLAVAIFGLVSFTVVIPVSYASYRILEKEAGKRLRAMIGDGQRLEITMTKA